MRLQIRIVSVPYQLHAVCLQAQALQRVFSQLFWLGHGAPRKGHVIVVARLACSVGGLSHRENLLEGNVRYWHLADIGLCAAQSGH